MAVLLRGKFLGIGVWLLICFDIYGVKWACNLLCFLRFDVVLQAVI